MRLYLDTADRAVAEPLLATGLFAGLTTNPTILARAGLTADDAPAVHRWARAAGAREVFFQSWGEDRDTPRVSRSAVQLLLGESAKRENWNVQLPADGEHLVARRGEAGGLEVHREEGELAERGPVVRCHVSSRTG